MRQVESLMGRVDSIDDVLIGESEIDFHIECHLHLSKITLYLIVFFIDVFYLIRKFFVLFFIFEKFLVHSLVSIVNHLLTFFNFTEQPLFIFSHISLQLSDHGLKMSLAAILQ